MRKIYASFSDPVRADQAIGALLDHGLHAGEVSLVRCGSENDYLAWKESPTASSAQGCGRQEEALMEEVARGLCMDERAAMEASESSHERAADLIASDYMDRRLEMDRMLEEILNDDAPAKSGISTTTSADMEVGAAKGAGVGLGAGIALAAASIFIPGFGFVAGGSALAAAITGAIGAAGAGVIAGAVTGYLVDQGADREVIDKSEKALNQFGAIVEVVLDDSRPDTSFVNAILTKYGANLVSDGPQRYMV